MFVTCVLPCKAEENEKAGRWGLKGNMLGLCIPSATSEVSVTLLQVHGGKTDQQREYRQAPTLRGNWLEGEQGNKEIMTLFFIQS